jgi:radical SAM superfamily enzyme YgiQ (UPF0313 family)
MRVLLIYPNIDCPIGVNHGLAMISGVLKEGGHETRLIHVNEKLFDIPSPDQVCKVIEEWKPGLIGFSVMTQQYPWSIQTADAIRKRFPEIPTVIGGVHVTMVPEDVTQEAHFDFVAVGEAEYALLELVNRLEKGGDLQRVPNMRIPARSKYNKNLTAIVNPVGPFPDLNRIAKKDYDLFDMPKIIQEKNGWLGLLTSRGCPYKCTYCFNKEIVDQYMEDGATKTPKEYLRHYPVERIIGEIKELQAKYPINTLIFDDDLFTLDRKYVHEFCTAYKESGIGLPYVVNAHVQVFDEDMAFHLKDSGCMIVKYGLESGSKRVRTEILWRYMTNDRIKESFAAAHKYDLHTSAFVMFGLPTETRAEIMETLQLCADVGMGRFRWAIFFPFIGTAGYRISNDLGVIDFDKLAGMGNYFDASCLKFSPEMDLLIEKLGRVCNWYVNALSPWPGCADAYKPLVAEVDGWTREQWEKNKKDLHKRDKELSEKLMSQGVRHYAIKYTHVMGVDSDFIVKERARVEEKPAYVPIGYTLDD